MTSDRKSVRALQRLAPKLLFGNASTSYRTCGQPSCRCHEGERHGPYLQVTYREGGRTRAYYVPQSSRETVLEGVRAWEEFQKLARELAERHREELGLGPRKRRSSRSRQR